MAKQQVGVEFFYDGAWHDVVSDDAVYTDPPIMIKHGGGAEGAVVPPSSLTVQLDNTTDSYRTTNPLSPLYGLAGRNTPCRVLVGGTQRGIGESSFEADQTDSFRRYPKRGRAWVYVDAGGVTQRINQWTDPLRSAFRYFNDQLTGVAGYWPMEDARGATVARSTIDGTRNSFLIGQSFGSQNSPPGGGTGIDVAAGSQAGFVFTGGNAASTAGWEYSVATYLGQMTSGWQILGVSTLANVGIAAFVDDSAQTINLVITSATGSSLFNSTFGTGRSFRGRWVLWHLRCTVSAGTVTIGASWRDVDDPTWVGVSGTYADTVTSDLRTAGMALPPDSTYGHVIGARGAPNLDSDERWDAFLGHAGELAADRFSRLCEENGISWLTSASSGSSAPMGPQPIVTLVDHFKEIAFTDDALIYDDLFLVAVFMLCGPDRLNQAPALTLTALSDTDLASAPREVLNDLDPHNVVTASQRDGGDYTVRDDTSPVGTQPPPAGAGEYKQTVDVNVSDEVNVLPQVAGWWLAKGTIDRPRFPTIVVNLVAAPYLIPAVEALRVGSVIEVADFREYTIRLHILGWTEKIGTHTRTVAFVCALDNAYDVGVLDTDRLAARATTLDGDIGLGGTALTLHITDQLEQWRTGNNQVPVYIDGELMILGTVGAVTGTGPWTQAVTGVTKGVNGIARNHKAGARVTVADIIGLTL